jgi:hypothetical protein
MSDQAKPAVLRLNVGLGPEPEREAFEAWMNPGRHACNLSPWVAPGRYEDDRHQMAWLGWKAGVAAERERLLAALCLMGGAALDAVRDDWTAGYARGIGACEEMVRRPDDRLSDPPRHAPTLLDVPHECMHAENGVFGA